MPVDEDMEQKILEAATTVFHRAGYDGARMQAIADEAGINKALLHYYFRSKDKLFEFVFRESLRQHLFPVVAILHSEAPLEEKLPKFIETHIDTMVENPYIPGFVLNEMSRHPNRLQAFMAEQPVMNPTVLMRQIADGIREGRYNEIEPRQFLASLLAMCVFPFVARPILSTVFRLDEAGYRRFLVDRKKAVTQMAMDLLVKK